MWSSPRMTCNIRERGTSYCCSKLIFISFHFVLFKFLNFTFPVYSCLLMISQFTSDYSRMCNIHLSTCSLCLIFYYDLEYSLRISLDICPSFLYNWLPGLLFSCKIDMKLKGKERLVSERTRSYSFCGFCMDQSELPVYFNCWHTWKQLQLPCHSFIRVQIHYKYRLSINRKNIITELKIVHGALMRAPASGIRS